MARRSCTRTGCSGTAVATLTYVYADSTAVLGPLALRTEPGSYDLCLQHSSALSVPRGWEVIRLPGEPAEPEPAVDDLLALADAVREAGFAYDDPTELQPAERHSRAGLVEVVRRGHLTVLAEQPAD